MPVVFKAVWLGSLLNSFVPIPLSDGGEADQAMGTKELFCRWLVSAAPRRAFCAFRGPNRVRRLPFYAAFGHWPRVTSLEAWLI